MSFRATVIALVAAVASTSAIPALEAASHPSESAVWSEQVVGRTGPGSLYVLLVPHDWNRKLVVYAHGFIPPTVPIGVSDYGFGALWEALGSRGYAVAYSSYSENGFAVQDGALRTHQLRGLFAARFGEPDRTYLMAHSMGSLVALMLAERHPEQYSGAMPMCGVVGGSPAVSDYAGDLRALFDYFYPGVLPGSVVSVPASLDVTQDIVLPALAAIQADPSGAFAIASIDQTPIPYVNPTELVDTILQGLAFHAVVGGDVLTRTHQHSPFSNAARVYTGALPPALLAAINAGIARFESTPDASEYLERYYQPDGALEIPVLTLHTTRDPVVPASHEAIYREIVATAGRSDLLVQRSFERYGHCTFTLEETLGALAQLVEWVENGVRPVP